jgi:hypothetical protein
MKVRLGFVSNSSSSSFICDICGYTEEVYEDQTESFYSCEKGHTFCRKHLKDFKFDWNAIHKDFLKEKWLTESDIDMISAMPIREFKDYYLMDVGEEPIVPTSSCPICSIKTLSKKDLIAYFLKKNSSSVESIALQVKEEFGNYSEFKKWLVGGRKKKK